MKIKTHEDFLNALDSVGYDMSDIEILSRYGRWNDKILVKSKYGESLINSHNMINDKTKPCLRNAVHKHLFFLEMLKEKNPKALDLKFIDEYETYFGKIRVEDKYGVMVATPAGLLSGSIPRINTAIDKSKYIISKFIELHGDYYDYSNVEYKKYKEDVVIICPVHGAFLQTPRNHLLRHGCQRCNNSKGEMRIENFLKKYNVKYQPQYSNKECRHINVLHFDFAIYMSDELILCEYDGKQHFHESNSYSIESYKLGKIRDDIKNKYCKEKGIKLIRIPYWDFENIENILIKELNLKENIYE